MRYENDILRPAVIGVLSQKAELQLHINLSGGMVGRAGRRLSVGLGRGSADLVGSVRYRAKTVKCCLMWQHVEERVLCVRCKKSLERHGAQLVAFELKRPHLPPGASCTKCCSACVVDKQTAKSECCRADVFSVRSTQRMGHLSGDQEASAEAWQRGGRWYFVVRRPDEARQAYAACLHRLEAMGLEATPISRTETEIAR